MKKQNTIRAAIIMLLFLAVGYVQASLVPVISTNPSCMSNDGSVTITGTGDPGPFYIYISTAGYTQEDSSIVSSITFPGLQPGNYTYYIYSTTGSSQQGTFSIGMVDNVQLATTQPVCPTGTTGSAIATVTGGTTPYTYSWSNGTTASTVTGLPVGVNTLTVVDAGGCFAIVSDTIQITSTVICPIAQTGPACNATLTASASGGSSPYMYVWSNGATTASINNLVTNNYTASVTDANGCTASSSAYIYNTGLGFDSIQTTVTQPTCSSNGSIALVMVSGTAPYLYLWSNGQTTATATGLASGNYFVTVTDANGCTGQNSFYLYATSLGEYNSIGNPTCHMSDGYVYIYAYGGTYPYNFTWSNGAGNVPGDSGITAGTYRYTVTDAAGCSVSDSAVLIPQGNFTAQVTTTNIICPATTGGSMTVNVTGAGPYTYLWSNGATTQTITNVPEDESLVVTATDANGCETRFWADSVMSTSPFSVTLSSVACLNTVTAI